MMGSLSEEEDQFFDTREDITSMSDSGSDCQENLDSDWRNADSVPVSFGCEVWFKNPESIRERRSKFLKWMGLGLDHSVSEAPDELISPELKAEIDRITENSGAVLRMSTSDDGGFSSRWSDDARDLFDGLERNLLCRIRSLDDGREYIVDELGQYGANSRLREVGSNRAVTIEEFERTLGLSPLVQRMMRKEVEKACNPTEAAKRFRRGWWRRLGAVACIASSPVEASIFKSNGPSPVLGTKSQTVKVRSYRKRSKEFSALYMGQDFVAHKGSILTMKFSPDGRYLGSAGEDGVVRVWLVTESQRSDGFDTPDADCSHSYFTVNHLSELVPINADKERKGKLKTLRKSLDATCIFPQKVFHISEKPLHEFHGHCGEVLDISWSKNKHLLSSSVDKTVRLWQVGCNQCLKVYSHNNYVTCVQFNPVDDNCFVSGSIDGKVRIWKIPGGQVVDWTDITEIVTAVCYRPDGKGVIVGSMNGNCRFYDASDNHLQLQNLICLQSKKKFPFKRITGFQFCPSDPTKLMVTTADSKIRILDGVDVICKYRGFRNTGSQISASFTSNGMHIVSASEDSNVYVWNYISQDVPVHSQANSNWSCERFFSNNASVAIPWCGAAYGNSSIPNISGVFPSSKLAVNPFCSGRENKAHQSQLGESSHTILPFSSSDHFSMGHGFFSESLCKGSATWPEEKLLTQGSVVVSSAICKSQYKVLKTSCQSLFGSPHVWGLVIVTAGWDGRIRSFLNYGLPIQK